MKNLAYSNRPMMAFALAIPTLFALACGTSIRRFDDDDDGNQSCMPGEAQACVCADGTTSVQTCFSDGNGFGACGCGTTGTGGTGGTTTVVGPGPTTATTTGVGPGPSTTTTTGPGPTTATTTATMMNGGLCNSGLTTGSDGLDACLTSSCCPQFNACFGDATCNACLQNAMAPGCMGNALLDAFNVCSDGNCPTNVCDSGITFNDGNGDPAFACIACTNDPTHSCCANMANCVGGGTMTEVQDCLTCLNDPAVLMSPPQAPTSGACFDLGPTIYNGAVGFQACLENECPTECGF